MEYIRSRKERNWSKRDLRKWSRATKKGLGGGGVRDERKERKRGHESPRWQVKPFRALLTVYMGLFFLFLFFSFSFSVFLHSLLGLARAWAAPAARRAWLLPRGKHRVSGPSYTPPSLVLLFLLTSSYSLLLPAIASPSVLRPGNFSLVICCKRPRLSLLLRCCTCFVSCPLHFLLFIFA